MRVTGPFTVPPAGYVSERARARARDLAERRRWLALLVLGVPLGGLLFLAAALVALDAGGPTYGGAPLCAIGPYPGMPEPCGPRPRRPAEYLR